MRVNLTIETSRYSESSTKRWEYGSEMYVEDVEIEIPDGTDIEGTEDWELLELAEKGLGNGIGTD